MIVTLKCEGFLPSRGVPHLHCPIVIGGGEQFAVRAERHTVDSVAMPRERHVSRRQLPLPVEPFETSAIDATLPGWKLLDELLLQAFGIMVPLPVPLDEIHSDVVQALLGQLGLLSFLHLGLEGVLLASLGIIAGTDRRTPLPHHTPESRRRHQSDQPQQSGDGRLPPCPLNRPLEHRDRPRQDRLAGHVATQILSQRLGRGVAPVRFLFQAFQADDLQVARVRGLPFEGASGVRSRTCSRMSASDSPGNGARPVRSEYKMAPSP